MLCIQLVHSVQCTNYNTKKKTTPQCAHTSRASVFNNDVHTRLKMQPLCLPHVCHARSHCMLSRTRAATGICCPCAHGHACTNTAVRRALSLAVTASIYMCAQTARKVYIFFFCSAVHACVQLWNKMREREMQMLWNVTHRLCDVCSIVGMCTIITHVLRGGGEESIIQMTGEIYLLRNVFPASIINVLDVKAMCSPFDGFQPSFSAHALVFGWCEFALFCT